MREITPGIYRHFKGKLYRVLNIAEHTETGEKMVVYQALYGDFCLFVRPYDMFSSVVDRGKYPNATQEFRFEIIVPHEQEEYYRLLKEYVKIGGKIPEVNTGYQPRGPLEFSAACLVCKNYHFPKGNVCKDCLKEIKSGFVLDCTKVFELAGRKEGDKE